MPSYRSLSLTVLIAVTAIGCRDRGADDRIALDEDLRQANHGPGYTVVALRTVDRARLSNSGAVIINESGLQPVYVTDVAYTRQTASEMRDHIRDLDALNERLKALQEGLDRATPAPVAPTPTEPVSVTPAPEAIESTPAAVDALPAVEAETVVPVAPASTSTPPAPANPGRGQFRRQVVDRQGNPITDANGNPITVGPTP